MRTSSEPKGIFAAVGAFLDEHHLSPEPANYAFAYDVICNPQGRRAREVAALASDGVRLMAADVVRLGGAAKGAPLALAPMSASDADFASPIPTYQPPVGSQNLQPHQPHAAERTHGDELATRTLAQIEEFSDTLRSIHHETNHFGRDLAETAEAIRTSGAAAGVERISHLTAAMIERVHQAETRLEQAKSETAELRAALEEARTSAQTDPLTELLNRRAFDDHFTALPRGTAVAVAICDIDHFKRVNDGFGHAVGDRVLKLVAQQLERETACTIARYGGEEFALLFELDDETEVLARIDAARDAIATRHLRVRETDRPIGTINFSAGVALGRASETLTPLMERADRALYAAKQAGRGRTIVAP
ncbi:GGDEF domain-containing protein [Sphingomonas sp. Mn802worker]|uniref:GGDEF domain-containing protein n=1 Tax=Sphingomonas sp. Mn802worker TaxID=629773 RepID=UPI00036A83FF|nr:GGDEF domain-containing protein [Sphingomonas sp. Mn802worker]